MIMNTIKRIKHWQILMSDKMKCLQAWTRIFRATELQQLFAHEWQKCTTWAIRRPDVQSIHVTQMKSNELCSNNVGPLSFTASSSHLWEAVDAKRATRSTRRTQCRWHCKPVQSCDQVTNNSLGTARVEFLRSPGGSYSGCTSCQWVTMICWSLSISPSIPSPSPDLATWNTTFVSAKLRFKALSLGKWGMWSRNLVTWLPADHCCWVHRRLRKALATQQVWLPLKLFVFEVLLVELAAELLTRLDGEGAEDGMLDERGTRGPCFQVQVDHALQGNRSRLIIVWQHMRKSPTCCLQSNFKIANPFLHKRFKFLSTRKTLHWETARFVNNKYQRKHPWCLNKQIAVTCTCNKWQS